MHYLELMSFTRSFVFLMALLAAQPTIASVCGSATAPALQSTTSDPKARSFARWTGILVRFHLEAIRKHSPGERIQLVDGFYQTHRAELTPARVLVLLKSVPLVARTGEFEATAAKLVELLGSVMRDRRATREELRALFAHAASKLPEAITEGTRLNPVGARLLELAGSLWPDGSHVLRTALATVTGARHESLPLTLAALEAFRAESLVHDSAQVEWFAKSLLASTSGSRHAPLSRMDAIRILVKRWGDKERELVPVAETRPNEIFESTMKNQEFQQMRGLEEYENTLLGFKARLRSLGPSQVWIDVGAGAARAIHDYLLSSVWFNAAPRVVAINAELPNNLSFIERIMKYQSEKFESRIGRVENIPLDMLPRADVLTDLYAAVSYSLHPDAVFNRYLQIMNIGGTAHVFISTIHSRVQLRGQSISMAEWLALGEGVVATSAWTPDAIHDSLHVAKMKEGAFVHELVTTSYTAGFPPKRVSEVAIIPERQ